MSDEEPPPTTPTTPSWTAFREIRPLLSIVLTVLTTAATGMFVVDKHARLMAEKEQALKREEFEADELAKYLALPHEDVLTKRGMATYLQAVYFANGMMEQHGWVTRQIDEINKATRQRRQRIGEAQKELSDARERRNKLTDTRNRLEAAITRLRIGSVERRQKEDELQALEPKLTAANAEFDRRRTELYEETRQTLAPEDRLGEVGLQGTCTIKQIADGTNQIVDITVDVTSTDACEQACEGRNPPACSAVFQPRGRSTTRLAMGNSGWQDRQ